MSIKKILIGIGILVIAIIAVLQINQPKVIIQNNKDVKNQKIKVNSLTYTCLSEMKNGVSEPYSCSFEDFERQKNKAEPIQTNEVDIGRVNERRNKVFEELEKEKLWFKNLTIEEQYRHLKKPMLELITDQSFVDYENNRVLFDKDNEIPRFDNKKVDEILDYVYENYSYKYHPEEYEVAPEEIKIVNYKFFQYLKPIEIKRMINDIAVGLVDGFDFYWLEDGNELKKVNFNRCENEICYADIAPKIRYSLFFACDNTCNGNVDYNSQVLSFNIDESGKLLLYNNLDENGKTRAETYNPSEDLD